MNNSIILGLTKFISILEESSKLEHKANYVKKKLQYYQVEITDEKNSEIASKISFQNEFIFNFRIVSFPFIYSSRKIIPTY